MDTHTKNLRQAIGLAATATLLIVSARDVCASDKQWRMPKTDSGQPDLQGYWDFGTTTALQRPKDLGEKRTYTDEEAQAVRNKTRANNLKMDASVDLSVGAPKAGDAVGQEADMASFERRDDLTRIDGEYRTSLVVDPPNGRIPVQTSYVDFHAQRAARGLSVYDGPDTMDAPTRCLAGPGVPTLYPYPWNANLQIVQNKSYVMLSAEAFPDARIVRLDSTHANGIQFWMGDSVGRWEGSTLVVHTTQFRPEQSYAFMMKASEEFELTERFTLISQNEILYRYTVVDPKAYSAPFTAERILKRLRPEVRIYEVACHEGNYSLGGILSGTRKQEQDASTRK
jgi:hypothetical protein